VGRLPGQEIIYKWNVGDVLRSTSGAGLDISDGEYVIGVCQSGTTYCDKSDNTFKIVRCNITDVYPVQVPGYTYYELFIKKLS
jgi:hypothetical protein